MDWAVSVKSGDNYHTPRNGFTSKCTYFRIILPDVWNLASQKWSGPMGPATMTCNCAERKQIQ